VSAAEFPHGLHVHFVYALAQQRVRHSGCWEKNVVHAVDQHAVISLLIMSLHVTLIYKREVRTLEYNSTAVISDVLNSAKELWQVENAQILLKGRAIPPHTTLASLTPTGMDQQSYPFLHYHMGLWDDPKMMV
jgi:hypothetical protein